MRYQKRWYPVKSKTKLTGHLIFFTVILSRSFSAAVAVCFYILSDIQCLISQRQCYISFMITSTKMTMIKTAMANPKISPPAGV